MHIVRCAFIVDSLFAESQRCKQMNETMAVYLAAEK